MSANPQALALFAKGQKHHQAGELGLAESHYQRVTKLDAANADAWHLLGIVAYQQGKVDKAIRHYRRAVELRPRAAEMLNNLALALRAHGEFDAAAEAFAQAIKIRPEYSTAAYNLGLLHEQRGDAAAAERAYRQALATQPNAANTLTNLGNLLRRLGRLDEAEKFLYRAHAASPRDAAANGNLAMLRVDQQRYADARALAETATRADPDNAAWWETLGAAARMANDADAAVGALRRACELAPDVAANHLQFGLACDETGDRAAAADALRRACELAPAWTRARWNAALALPWLPHDYAEANAAVARVAANLDALHAELDRADAADAAGWFEAAEAVGLFQLAYLPGDHTATLARYGDLVERVVRLAHPTLAMPIEPRVREGRVRVGFVSAYLHAHVVERYFGGWIRELDPARFERHVWYTGATPDDRLAAIVASADHSEAPPAELPALAERIRTAQLDVLIYLDVGMDVRQAVLAAMRLAPVQCAAYGHPATTGLASVDYYLSADALEPPGGEAHYRERLVRLPGLGCAPRAPVAPGDGAWFDALRDGARPLVACLQNLTKLPPAFDATLARVLAASDGRLVVFHRGEALARRFRARIEPVLRAHGLDPARHLVIESPRPYAEFLGGVARADLVLDTPGFSGGGTSLDALAMAAPVVCYDGRFARGRQTAGMLRMLGVDATIARDDDHYVTLATTLLADAARRDALRATLRERAQRLFAAPDAVKALESFLLEATRAPLRT
ncbi:tetratricopeptide repeat protein [Tahibacter soli]|uniref:protein O-GlcNAc transferase n=1 Tax=Tahibacter soli TaxID=2983605 RepID=A0A9X4BMK0_9GAMM|nr:tetratricopeptide repeat protein [Tahibacter soli]MDC8015404.1 tetratricopeptide repeat protein [Tahibacter soli]